MSETKIKLRGFMVSDAAPLLDILNSGTGRLIGEPGIITPAELDQIRAELSAEQVIIAERQLKTYVVGFCGIKNYNVAARRAELYAFCLASTADRSIPDKKTASVILDWTFGVLGLNKVSIDVLDGNLIMSSLEENGFTSEGVRRSEYTIGTKRVDATVMGCLAGSRAK
jgi:hypothetical protein